MSSRNHLSSKQLAGFVDTLVHQPGVNTWIKDVELAANKYFGMVVAPCALRYVIKKKFVFDGLMASGKICDPMNDQRKIWRKGFVLDCCLATTGHAGDGTDIHDGGGGSGSDGGGSDGGGSGGSDGGGGGGGGGGSDSGGSDSGGGKRGLPTGDQIGDQSDEPPAKRLGQLDLTADMSAWRVVGDAITNSALSFSLTEMCAGISYVDLNLSPGIAAKLGEAGVCKTAKIVKAVYQALQAAQQVLADKKSNDLDRMGRHDCMPIMVNIVICVMCLTDCSNLGVLTSILTWLPAVMTNAAGVDDMHVKACTPTQLARLCAATATAFKQWVKINKSFHAAQQRLNDANAYHLAVKQKESYAQQQFTICRQQCSAAQAAAELVKLRNPDTPASRVSGAELAAEAARAYWTKQVKRAKQAQLVVKAAHQAVASASRNKLGFDFAAQLAN
jgi:hypothetical protein